MSIRMFPFFLFSARIVAQQPQPIVHYGGSSLRRTINESNTGAFF
jgi:hypothetical protein